MARATKESRLAETIAKALDTLEFDYIHATYIFSRYSSAIHKNLFELVMSLLNHWAFLYDNGGVEKRDPTYLMCQMASKMVKAL